MKRYRALTDAKTYMEAFLSIKTKQNEIVPFRLNAAQRRLYARIEALQREGKPIRIIILKSRQMGFSTLTEALIYHRTATRKNVNSLIITHKDEATTNLFNMSRLFQERNPVAPMLKNSNARELLFENPARDSGARAKKPGLKSRIKCTTAGGKGVGRSDTLTNIHASEIAFWPGDIAATFTGLMQAVPHTAESMVILESTAKGFNFFKELWDEAVAGGNDFEPFFAPWFELEEYRMPYHGETLTAEEEALQAAFGLDAEQLMWRRWCIRNNCKGDREQFQQEYPATPEEAFLATGSCVFQSRELLLRLRQIEGEQPPRLGRFQYTERRLSLSHIELDGIAFEEAEKGEIALFRPPESGRPYTIGGDTAGEGSDYFTAQVIDNITGEQAARLRWQQCDEDEYAKQVYCLGRQYNNALIALEVNFSTHPQKVLEYLRYPRLYVREVMDDYTGRLQTAYGFRTDSLTRPVLIARLTEFLRERLMLVHDRQTLLECLTFIRNERGRAEAERGAHDDLVIAYGIALSARGQQRLTTAQAENNGRRQHWTADQWEDYENADREQKAYLRKKWG